MFCKSCDRILGQNKIASSKVQGAIKKFAICMCSVYFSLEVCDPSYPSYFGNATMCPLCDIECTYWKLHNACLAAKVQYMGEMSIGLFRAGGLLSLPNYRINSFKL